MEEKLSPKMATAVTSTSTPMNVSEVITTSVTKTVVHKTNSTTNLQAIAENDRKSMESLNARFDNYIKRVKLLEEFNKSLMAQLIEASKRLNNESRNIIAEMQPALTNIRQTLDKTVLDKVVAEIRQRRSNYKSQQMKAKCSVVLEEIDEIKEKITSIKAEKKNLDDEIQYIQSKIASLANENIQTKKENSQLESEIERLETELEAEVMSRVRLQTEVQSLEEELPFMRAVFEESINTLNKNKNSSVPENQFYQHELEKAVRELREDFEKQNKRKSVEMTEYYESKINEVKTLLKTTTVDKGNNSSVENINSLQDEIRTIRNDISLMSKKNADLTEQLHILEEEYEKQRLSNQERVLEKQIALDKMQQQIDEIADKYEATMADKSSLEFEIRTYTRLLDEEEARITTLNKSYGITIENETTQTEKQTQKPTASPSPTKKEPDKMYKDESVSEKDPKKNMQESNVMTTQITSKNKSNKDKPSFNVKCRCGKDTKVQDESNIIQCDDCHTWSHTVCYNVKDGAERKRRKFYCEKCYQNMKRQKQ